MIFRTTRRLLSTPRLRLRALISLFRWLRSRLGVCFWNDRPSLIEVLGCSRLCMCPHPSRDCRNRDYSIKETHGRPHYKSKTKGQCKLTRGVPEDAFVCRQKVSAYRCCRPWSEMRVGAPQQSSGLVAAHHVDRPAVPGARRISTKKEAPAAIGKLYTPLLSGPWPDHV